MLNVVETGLGESSVFEKCSQKHCVCVCVYADENPVNAGLTSSQCKCLDKAAAKTGVFVFD